MPSVNFSSSETDHYSGINAYTPEAAFMANLEGSANDGWYLNNSASHYLTNNIKNMHIRE